MKQEVINDLLGYDGLKIIQRPDIFNFSLDSTLLAHFVSINKSDKMIKKKKKDNFTCYIIISIIRIA